MAKTTKLAMLHGMNGGCSSCGGGRKTINGLGERETTPVDMDFGNFLTYALSSLIQGQDFDKAGAVGYVKQAVQERDCGVDVNTISDDVYMAILNDTLFAMSTADAIVCYNQNGNSTSNCSNAIFQDIVNIVCDESRRSEYENTTDPVEDEPDNGDDTPKEESFYQKNKGLIAVGVVLFVAKKVFF